MTTYLTVTQALARYHWPTPSALYEWLRRRPASVKAALVSRRGRVILLDADLLDRYIRTGSVEAPMPFRKRA